MCDYLLPHPFAYPTFCLPRLLHLLPSSCQTNYQRNRKMKPYSKVFLLFILLVKWVGVNNYYYHYPFSSESAPSPLLGERYFPARSQVLGGFFPVYKTVTRLLQSYFLDYPINKRFSVGLQVLKDYSKLRLYPPTPSILYPPNILLSTCG